MAAYEFTVSVRTQYLPEQSDPERTNYVFTYSITIKNTGTVAAQLISRHWVITDANNHVEEVRGLGVVGHQPLLQPGEQFEYTSGTQMATPQGSMVRRIFLRGRRWPPVRSEDPRIRAVAAAHPALISAPGPSGLVGFPALRAFPVHRGSASGPIHGPPHDKYQQEQRHACFNH